MKKYIYLFDLENNQYVNIIFTNKKQAQKYLDDLYQVKNIDLSNTSYQIQEKTIQLF